MANTYTQIHIQSVFAVKYRHGLINEDWEDELYKYMSSIIQNNGHKSIIINGMPDHIHILFGFRPTQSLSQLMQIVKQDSSKWINKNKLVGQGFSWQKGYASFSYSKSQLPRLINYIQNQKKHHAKNNFKDEYLALLKTHHVDYDVKYIFDDIR